MDENGNGDRKTRDGEIGIGEATPGKRTSTRNEGKEGVAKVQKEDVKTKDSVFKRVIEKIGLDAGTVMMMFKYVLYNTRRRREYFLLIEEQRERCADDWDCKLLLCPYGIWMRLMCGCDSGVLSS